MNPPGAYDNHTDHIVAIDARVILEGNVGASLRVVLPLGGEHSACVQGFSQVCFGNYVQPG